MRLTLALSLLLPSLTAFADAPPRTFDLSLRHVRTTDAAQVMADLTGKAFSVPTVSTDLSVDMSCKRKLTADEAYTVFLLSMASKGIRVSNKKVHVLMKEPNALVHLPDAEPIDARIVPALVDNVPNGLFIYQIRPGSVFDRAGLHDGDVVKEANGQPIEVSAGPCALFEAVTDLHPATLLIERKQQITLSLNSAPAAPGDSALKSEVPAPQ